MHNLDTNGRAMLKVNGHRRTAARAVWEHCRGPIPDGMCVCHSCDKPNCIFIGHLFLGTHTDNMRDKAAKGRCNVVAGARHYRSRLSDDDVRAIRTEHSAGRASYAELAARYGMSKDGIRFIVKGLRRKGV